MRPGGSIDINSRVERGTLEHELEDYLHSFWECLGTEVPWIKQSVTAVS